MTLFPRHIPAFTVRTAAICLAAFCLTAVSDSSKTALSAPSKNIKGTYKGTFTLAGETTTAPFTLKITKQTKLPNGAYILQGKVTSRGRTINMTHGILNLSADDNISLTGALGSPTAPVGTTGVLGSINLSTRRIIATWSFDDFGNNLNDYYGDISVKKSN